MDFFSAQEQARKRTKKMVLLFCAAVFCIALALYAVLVFSLESDLIGVKQGADIYTHLPETDLWRPKLFGATLLGVGLLVGSCSMFKIAQLRSGGGVVARSLGGRRLDRATKDADERKLLNVVEEISIASGVAMPDVYLLNESGINAFAAGFKPADAVIGVTRGCMETLSRDELQGVIAHEFSHILNGDMRLNIRLMGVVFGILAIAVIGQTILRGTAEASFYSSASRRRSHRDNSGGSLIAILLIGGSIMAIGYIGVFFGRLIQSAISRQREYLADAAAVQFTRNPEGISGALKKIGGGAFGGMVRNAHTQETAHFFFANALKPRGGGFFATHPPLPERIRAIEPNWDGRMIRVTSKESPEQKALKKQRPKQSYTNAPDFIGTVGQISVAAIMEARQLRAGLEDAFQRIQTSQDTARAILLTLMLIAGEATEGTRQLAALKKRIDINVYKEVEDWLPQLNTLNLNQRFALLETALPKAAESGLQALEQLDATMKAMAHSDGEINLEELALLRSVNGYIRDRKQPSRSVKALSPSQMEMPVSVLLSALAYISGSSDQDREKAFKAGARKCGRYLLKEALLLPKDRVTFTALETALELFHNLPSQQQKVVFEAALSVVIADGKIAEDELSLIRVIAVGMGLPMPALSVS